MYLDIHYLDKMETAYRQFTEKFGVELLATLNGKTGMTKGAIVNEVVKALGEQRTLQKLEQIFSVADSKPKKKASKKIVDDADDEVVPKQKNWGQLWTSKDHGCRTFFPDEFKQFAEENPEYKGFAVHIRYKETIIGTPKYQQWVAYCREAGVAPASDPPTEVTPKKPKAKVAKKGSSEKVDVKKPNAKKAVAKKASAKKASDKKNSADKTGGDASDDENAQLSEGIQQVPKVPPKAHRKVVAKGPLKPPERNAPVERNAPPVDQHLDLMQDPNESNLLDDSMNMNGGAFESENDGKLFEAENSGDDEL